MDCSLVDADSHINGVSASHAHLCLGVSSIDQVGSASKSARFGLINERGRNCYQSCGEFDGCPWVEPHGLNDELPIVPGQRGDPPVHVMANRISSAL